MSRKPSREGTAWDINRLREDNIEKDLEEIVCEVVNWIKLTQFRVHWRAAMNTVIKHSCFMKVWNFLTSWTNIILSWKTAYSRVRQVGRQAGSHATWTVLTHAPIEAVMRS